MWKTKIKKSKHVSSDTSQLESNSFADEHHSNQVDKKYISTAKNVEEDVDLDDAIEYHHKSNTNNKRHVYSEMNGGKMDRSGQRSAYDYRSAEIKQSSIRAIEDRNFKNTVSKRDLNWETQYEALVNYANKHGHCNVRSAHPDSDDKPHINLYAWLALQRRHKKSNKLRPDREQKLQILVDEGKLGWFGENVNEKSDSASTPPSPFPKWEHVFESILIYAEEHGHANVPLNTLETIDSRKNQDLGLYVQEKRLAFADGTLDNKQFEKLNILHKEGKFLWVLPSDNFVCPDVPQEMLDRRWVDRFHAVSKFAHIHPQVLLGDDISGTLTCESSMEVFDLNTWIVAQRKRYAAARLQPNRVTCLQSLVDDKCFLWVSVAESQKIAAQAEKQAREEEILWSAWYNALLWQAKNVGHCNLEGTATIMLPDGSEAELGKWLHRQRSALKKGTLRVDRASKIKSLVDNRKLDFARWNHIFIARYPSLCESTVNNNTNDGNVDNSTPLNSSAPSGVANHS